MDYTDYYDIYLAKIDELSRNNKQLLDALKDTTSRFDAVYQHCNDGWGTLADYECIENAKQVIENASQA